VALLGGGFGSTGYRDAFRLPAVRASVAEARQRVVAQLLEWGVGGETRDSAELVVSELVTNAVCHTNSETIDCELRLTGGRLHVEVADEGYTATEPRPGTGNVDGEGGRGLLLVEALSEEWGVRSRITGQGHAVWAALPNWPTAGRSGRY
jgi:anti-sigma regulatory factor (Ser/Thr protein kinase)